MSPFGWEMSPFQNDVFFEKKKTQLPKMDRSAGLTGKTSLEKINIVSAKKQLLLKKQKNTIRKMQV